MLAREKHAIGNQSLNGLPFVSMLLSDTPVSCLTVRDTLPRLCISLVLDYLCAAAQHFHLQTQHTGQ